MDSWKCYLSFLVNVILLIILYYYYTREPEVKLTDLEKKEMKGFFPSA